jgi:hypothetical protein
MRASRVRKRTLSRFVAVAAGGGRTSRRSAEVVLGVLVASLLTAAGASVASAQDYRAPRTPDGKPDLNGVWQALGSAHWDLEAHAARPGPVLQMGALGAIPAGLGIVEGGEIPYQPEARTKRDANRAKWLELDPAVKCYMPGVPRATYMPFPFQIVQTPDTLLIAYEFAGASRMVYMNKPDFESPGDMWMGHSRGHWEGETLVVDVTSQVPDTWLDSSGNFHGEKLHVVERWTAKSPYHLLYEATIEDPTVYTRPWTISLPLYRRVEDGAQLLEFKCVEFVEEMMYGHLRKKEGGQ